MHHPQCLPAFLFAALLFCGGALWAGVDRWTPLGPDGGDVTALAAPVGVSGLVFAGTGTAGVFVSRDAGESWQSARAGIPSGEKVRFLTAGGPGGRNLFAATDRSFYASENGGLSWSRRHLPALIPGIWTWSGDLLSLTASADARTVFLTFGPNVIGRLLRSTDGGRTWAWIETGFENQFPTFFTAAIAPSSPATVYLSSRGWQGRILRSLDGGSTWAQVGALPEESFYEDMRLVVDPRDARRVYAAFGDQVMRSMDGGASWEQLATAEPATEFEIRRVADLVIDPSAPSTLYFAYDRHVPGYEGWYDGGILKFEGRIFRSVDGGASWTRLKISDAVAAIRLDGGRPGRVYAGVSRIGILRSENRGAVWSRSDRGLRAASLCAVTPDPHVRDLLYISAGVCEQTFDTLADNGDLGFLKGGQAQSWTNVSRALRDPVRVLEAYDLVADPQTPGTLYAATGHGLFKSVDGGGGWRSLQGTTLTPILEAVESIAVDPVDPQRLYAAGFRLGYPYCGGFCPLEPISDLARSTDGGVTWSRLLPPTSQGYRVWIAPHDPSLLYASGARGSLLVSTDRGATWVSRPVQVNGMPSQVIVLHLEIDPTAPQPPQTLYAVTFSWATVTTALVKSTDGGLSWVRTSRGLPDYTDIRDLALDPEQPSTLYAATSRGVFLSRDAGAHWSLLSKGLTGRDVVRVRLDPFHPATIYAATRGDGGLFVLTRSDR